MVAVVVSGGVVEARGGEWYSGSNRSCDEEKIGTWSEKLTEKDGKRFFRLSMGIRIIRQLGWCHERMEAVYE
ncbi:hypothetical protein Tco_1018399 [Tanacetum coccineum]|uniref:Uncharacterized protein n=1 Tax=Tanacetum coccineum TaxID=301880 RepID=A0ABQ5FVA4_9ASTR